VEEVRPEGCQEQSSSQVIIYTRMCYCAYPTSCSSTSPWPCWFKDRSCILMAIFLHPYNAIRDLGTKYCFDVAAFLALFNWLTKNAKLTFLKRS
jgi:hypothetical protein